MMCPVNQSENLTMHYRSSAYCLLFRKGDTVGLYLSSMEQKVYQKGMNFHYNLVYALECILGFWSLLDICHGMKKKVLNECLHQCCSYRICLLSVTVVHGQNFPWKYQNFVKKVTTWMFVWKGHVFTWE